MRHRRAGRVIVTDHDHCVLLAGATSPGEGHWWFTPGGGTDRDETPREAARRELAEETGIAVDLDDDPVLHRRARFMFLGHFTEQVETFWYRRLDHRPTVVSHHLEDYEAEAIDRWAWWSPDDLAGLVTREPVFPACLPDLLEHLRGERRDRRPWVEEQLDDRPGPARAVDVLPEWVRS